MGMCWALGAASYYVLPSLGPVYARPGLFSDLPVTAVTRLQEALLENRVEVLTDPWATGSLHGIGAFASLHVGDRLHGGAGRPPRWRWRPSLRWGMWVFFVLTTLSTVYFGWHYLLDDVAGLGIGWFSVWLAGVATGQHRAGRRAGRAGRARPQRLTARDRRA